MQESSPLTAAVVGAGLGGSLSIRALRESPRFRLVGVADVRAEALEQYAADVATFTGHEEMLKTCTPDVVCVSTYAPSHLELTRAALDAGARGLLVEKPLSDTTADGRAVLDLALERGVPVVVPHGLMTMSGPAEVLSRVRDGAVGELRLVEIECAQWDVINAGIHWLQFFLALVHPDPVETVLTAADTSSRTYRDGMQVETEAVVLARTRGGVRVVLNTGDYLPIARERTGALFRIVGTTGFIEYAPWENGYTIVADGQPRLDVQVEQYEVALHRRHLEHLADLVVAGTTDDYVPETSLAALELVEAAYLSHRVRAAVTLPLSSYTPPDPAPWDPGMPYSGTGGGRNGREL
ncbi:Gfo/Idh/MocA family protein [Jiangella mangrovi]|uniref:Putative dehydrogenase n=1 Tax=Jiangella mangrovi TaxID=1524084 RepID=A0A7W9GWW2_9ACTN|nr:Gfo/Idh/MocA family oxidoreductase [Jiangella mangrovi]MBB5791258.1 putative dehydrogenase [Jiangella mangrovi]